MTLAQIDRQLLLLKVLLVAVHVFALVQAAMLTDFAAWFFANEHPVMGTVAATVAAGVVVTFGVLALRFVRDLKKLGVDS